MISLILFSSFILIYEILFRILSRDISWYILHFIVNLISISIVYNDVWRLFSLKYNIDDIEPDGGLLEFKNPLMVLNCLLTSLHLFHIRYSMRLDDYMHHIFMMISLNICFFYMVPIYATSFIFFLNGIPGAIDYLLLILVKRKLISSIKEKRINTYLNSYIRGPGTLILIGIIMTSKKLDINFFSVFCLLTTYFNAVYYTRSVCINYGQKRLLE